MKARTRIWLLFLAPKNILRVGLQTWVLGALNSAWGRVRDHLTGVGVFSSNSVLSAAGNLFPWRQSRTQACRWCQLGHWCPYLPQEHLSVHTFAKEILVLTCLHFCWTPEGAGIAFKDLSRELIGPLCWGTSDAETLLDEELHVRQDRVLAPGMTHQWRRWWTLTVQKILLQAHAVFSLLSAIF